MSQPVVKPVPDAGENLELRVPWIETLAEWALEPGERLIDFSLPVYLHRCVVRLARRLARNPVRVGGRGTRMPQIYRVPDRPMDRHFTVGDVLLAEDPGLVASPMFVCEDVDGEVGCHSLLLLVQMGIAEPEAIDRFVDRALARLLEELAVEADVIAAERAKRPARGSVLPGLYLPGGVQEDVLGDIESFLNSYDLCRELKIPWRRGYLFYGPPGNGKSRLIRQLGEHFELPLSDIGTRIGPDGSLRLAASFNDPDDVHIENQIEEARREVRALIQQSSGRWVVRSLANGAVPAGVFARLMALRRPEAFYLEDLDKFVAFQGGEKHKDAPKVPLHELLKALDGVEGISGTVIFMTTNYPEMVAEALVRRPGRVDRIWNLGLPDPPQMVRLLDGLGYQCEGKPALEVAKELCAEKASMAFAEELVRALRMRHRRKDFTVDEVNAELKIIREHLDLTDPDSPKWNSRRRRPGFREE